MNALRVPKLLNSLRVRIVLSALIITVVLLPSIGIALNNAFSQQIRSNVKDHLNAYFYSLLAITEFENGELVMPEALLENQFNVINSGLYALISRTNDTAVDTSETDAPQNEDSNILWFSNSFLGANISEQLPSPEIGNDVFAQIMLNEQAHFIYSFSVRFDVPSNLGQANASPQITLHIIKDLASVTEQQRAFSQLLWTWLSVLIVVLLLIQIFWLAWILKPLAGFTKELNAVQKGEAEQLTKAYPNELQSVAKQLNALLSNEQRQRQRYRNALSDLAHSLKTPLAVIQSQKALSDSSKAQIEQINHTIERQLKRAQSAGNQAWHLGVFVSPVCKRLISALGKIYPNIQVYFETNNDDNSVFRGDESDLTEMLGNLMDNACKAAKSRVELSISSTEECLFFSVEDDGKGISESQQPLMLERGKRLDTYEKGHGIGLAIVRDLVDSYEGKLTISRSESLGGAKFTLSFKQTS